MICWWCGGKLVNPFGKLVEGKLLRLFDGQEVKVHKICSADAERALKDEKVTARESERH